MSASLEAKNKKDQESNDLSKAEKVKIVDKVVELLLAKERKGWSERGEKKIEFQKLADKFNISVKTITNNYYKRVLPVVKEEEEKKEQKAQRKAKLKVISNENGNKIENKDKQEEMNLIEQTNKAVETNETNEKVETVEETIGTTGKNDEVEAIETKTETVTNDKENEKKVDFDKNFDDYLNSTHEETKKKHAKFERDVYGRPLKPPYKHNDILEVRVDHIRDFGVFCYTCDEYEYKGLIHISEIKDIYVADPNDYFNVGDIIKVKVLMSTVNRLTFSTKDMKLQLKKEKEEEEVKNIVLPKNPPINTIGDKFGKELQSKLNTITEESKEDFQNHVNEILDEEEATIENSEIEALLTDELMKESEQTEQTKEPTFTGKISERDFNDVQSFINNKIGALSPKAKNKLLEILEKKGMFKSSIAINQVSDKFVVDYGLIFMMMLDKELSKDECL